MMKERLKLIWNMPPTQRATFAPVEKRLTVGFSMFIYVRFFFLIPFLSFTIGLA
jgi:hypothetical protein